MTPLAEGMYVLRDIYSNSNPLDVAYGMLLAIGVCFNVSVIVYLIMSRKELKHEKESIREND